MTLGQIAAIVFTFAFAGFALWIIMGELRKMDRRNQLHQRHRERRTRINAKAPEHPLMFAPGVSIQLNADGSLPEWIQIAPFGDWPTRDKKAVQQFNADAAKQVISWFNFWPRRIARLANINTVKVWVGHPDFAPDEWPERIDLGSIVELKEDEHGLNARVEWNAGADAHVAKHKFPSVAWDCDEVAPGVEVPALLWSVGMWHKPNIKSVRPVINAAGDESDADKPADETQTETNMLNKILEALRGAGITNEGDDENAVLGAIGSLIQNLAWKREEKQRQDAIAAQMRTALNAVADVGELPDDQLPDQVVTQLNAQVAEVARLNERITQLNAQRINAVVERALETGRIIKADEEAVRAELNADFDAAHEKLIARTVQLNTSSLNIGSHKPGITQAAERFTRLNAWLEEYQQTHGCDRDAAWKASEADPQMKGIHEAMKAADQARTSVAE